MLKRLRDLDIRFEEVVLAQVYLETGYLSSPIYQQNANLFGMKKKKGKKNPYTKEENLGHALYENRNKSLQDYKRYQKMILKLAKEQGYLILSNEDYLWLLDHLPHCRNCRYAEDPQYTNKLRAIMAAPDPSL